MLWTKMNLFDYNLYLSGILLIVIRKATSKLAMYMYFKFDKIIKKNNFYLLEENNITLNTFH